MPGDDAVRFLMTGLQSRADVAALVGLEHSDLTYILYVRGVEQYYHSWEIKKKSGGTRDISAPSGALYVIQRELNRFLQGVYQPKAAVHGFVKGRSIVTNAENHVRKKYVFNVDLRDFFPTLNFGRVRGMFMARPFEYPPSVATVLATICCYQNGLPVGAPTSPVVANMICLRMDAALLRLAREHGCWYSRYADDITFSTNRPRFPDALFARTPDGGIVGAALEEVIRDNGFLVNEDKVRLQSQADRQIVTGVVVNERLNVRRRYIRQIRAMIHAWDKYGLGGAQSMMPRWYTKDRFTNEMPRFDHVLRGRIAFLSMVRGGDDPLVQRFQADVASLQLTGSVVAAPSPAVVITRSTRELRILHLSDFHFSSATKWDSDYLLRSLPDLLRAEGLAPDLVVVTGDIANTGRPDEYEQARLWFVDGLAPAVSVDPSKILFVPGNHDIARAEVTQLARSLFVDVLDAPDRDAKLARALEDAATRAILLRPTVAYSSFIETLAPGSARSNPWWGESFQFDDLTVRVAGFSTAWMSTGDREQGRLLIGKPQVEEVLKADLDGGDLHLSLFHHPLEWMHEGDRAARQRILDWSSLLLHGHLHAARPLHGGSLGSTSTPVLGGASAYQGSSYANGVQYLELSVATGKGTARAFRWSVDDQRWFESHDAYGPPREFLEFEFPPPLR